MVSIRAQVVKSLLRVANRRVVYDASSIAGKRSSFEKNLSLVLPNSSRYVRRRIIADVPVDIVDVGQNTKRAIVYLHGGGFVMGSTKAYRQHLKRISKLCAARVYAIDYTLSPEAPYPQALNEIQEVWEMLLAEREVDPAHTTFMGDSAGANLALVSLLRFRDADISMPASLVLLSPFLDMTLGGSSYRDKATDDPLLTKEKVKYFADSYVGITDKRNPYISPVFATLKGLPPILIHVGEDEILLSDARMFAENAKRDGVDATLFLGAGMWHGWHVFAAYVPEARRAMESIARFVSIHK